MRVMQDHWCVCRFASQPRSKGIILYVITPNDCASTWNNGGQDFSRNYVRRHKVLAWAVGSLKMVLRSSTVRSSTYATDLSTNDSEDVVAENGGCKPRGTAICDGRSAVAVLVAGKCIEFETLLLLLLVTLMVIQAARC